MLFVWNYQLGSLQSKHSSTYYLELFIYWIVEGDIFGKSEKLYKGI